jgi:hypothetical protein
VDERLERIAILMLFNDIPDAPCERRTSERDHPPGDRLEHGYAALPFIRRQLCGLLAANAWVSQLHPMAQLVALAARHRCLKGATSSVSAGVLACATDGRP